MFVLKHTSTIFLLPLEHAMVTQLLAVQIQVYFASPNFMLLALNFNMQAVQ